MKLLAAAAGLAALSEIVTGTALSHGSYVQSDSALALRALPNAPDEYAPANVDCPSTRPSVRSAADLSSDESSWLEKRRNNTIGPMKDLLKRNSIAKFDAVAYIDKVSNNATDLPNIGIAVSGGGYRALMNGAGALKAFDSRTTNATSSGQLGGLLQSATYVAGLSGGGWLVGSIFVNNFTTVQAIQADDTGSVWEFGNSIFKGPKEKGVQVLNTVGYYKNILNSVQSKRDGGYDASITDYWGRALSFQLINATDGGINYTWSSIALTDDFKNGNMPLPILVADGRNPGELLVGSNSTVFEFNPWEFGTFDPTVFGFIPLEFLGSKFDAGSLPSDAKCVRGFDNAGYVMGTSSSLFNQFFLQLNSTDLSSSVKSIANDILTDLSQNENDIASYEPNPFFGYSNHSSPFATQSALNMVDGGEDLQNIPLHPLTQPERGLDVVFAVDSSADTTYNWPNGTAMVATYERSLNRTGIANGTAFPSIPDQNTFVNLGLNNRPTFFGCNSSNMTGPAPLVVYIPNSPYVTLSNVSTFDPSYNNTQRDAIILNGFNAATMANATRDSDWPTCVSCAILSRSLERTNTAVPDACTRCFQKYCWDGTVNSTTPASYEPPFALAEVSLQSAALAKIAPSLAVLVAALVAGLTPMF